MTAPKAAVVLDFDGTLMPKRTGALYEVVKRRVLSPSLWAENEKLMARFMPKGENGAITEAEELEWFNGAMDLYFRAGLTKEQAEQALAHIRLRPGVVECLRQLKELEIPAAIVSFGVTQFIESVLINQGARDLVGEIYAARFIEHEGKFVGVDRASVVLPHSKGYSSLQFANRHGVHYSRILAAGDSLTDDQLGYLPENRLGVANNTVDYNKLSESHAFGGVVFLGNGNFVPAAQWLLKKISEL